MSRLCKKKKKKAARRVKEELKETTSEEMDTKEEKEINRVVRDQVWPGTSGKAKRRSVRHVMEEHGDQGHDIVVVNSEGEGQGRDDRGHDIIVVNSEGMGQWRNERGHDIM